ncbi:SLATT domain-containing protein [Marinomonas posidonica]|uniref:SMODS and SLOG-associating 2TM effector domain-containing protein n=1 Tax=Marinomonas posidonica (strain CECT 7376 / NCIMB 14433 / IVIA-Po-181) TaxID=491952 RepID=F6CYH1_MARPP|nr:SLATT domain-containing protein [Marinomonas posidonica]AEF54580.1 hypothetical protein Mar181_1538 [Marinomonas posidonica IVIA-Po-181]
MSEGSRIGFLDKSINGSIKTIKAKAKWNKTKASIINALIIMLGALITLTLGVDVDEDLVRIQKNLALIFGALLTLLSGWNVIFDYRKLWIRQKITLLALYQLKNEFDYYKVDENSNSDNMNKKIDSFFLKYQEIWDKDGQEWRDIIKNEKIRE